MQEDGRKHDLARVLLQYVDHGQSRHADTADDDGLGLRMVHESPQTIGPLRRQDGPEGLIDGKPPGNPSKLNDAQRQALVSIVESGPIPAIHGLVRWRLKDLARWVLDKFGITLDETTVGRELSTLVFRRLSARPRHHQQNEALRPC